MHLVARFSGNRLAMITQTFHHHLDHFFDVLKRLLGGVPPSGATLPDKRWTVGMPAILVWLNDNLEGIGFHFHSISIPFPPSIYHHPDRIAASPPTSSQ